MMRRDAPFLAPQAAPLAGLRGRPLLYAMFRLWWLKASGTTVFITLFFTAYVHLLKNPSGAVTEMPLLWLDQAVGVHTLALPVYVSLWVYVSLPTLLLFTVAELASFGLAAALLCLSGLACFYLWPTAVPPANIDWGQYPGFAFMKGMDAAGNACPSLHVATAVFSACWLQALLRRIAAPAWLNAANWLWCLAIAYSTLATKQHVAVDMLAGIALGGVAGLLSLRACADRLARYRP
ncbi:hypothetical protein OTERR_03410 [Oryzomicrobium terrae]|uniref:Phosphatidic acid phosphatase type 2/haloperoxidase domain-containing protein n=1 Tax=Oryzomicrobium terrae TaxID=1735038 RepID=A0A5C1E693_9RHOO|nr:phosphatase PAP2 family protein [Oryzomicrobium terrae]QEL63817.1 hypothetical protein OTERR_03410 [Oryzomicrobium terrae]